MKPALVRALAILIVAAMVAYVATRRGLLESLLEVPPASVALLVLLSIANVAAQSLQFRQLSLVFGLNLRSQEWIGLTAVNTMANYSLPARTGLVVRAGYLARVHDMSFSRYAALAAASLGLMLFIAAAGGLLVSLAVLDGAALAKAAIFFLSVLGALAAGTIGVKLISVLARLSQRVTRFVEGFRRGMAAVAQGGAKSIWFVVWTFAVFLIQSARLAVAFGATGIEITLAEAVIIAAAGALAIIVSITPGGLGIKEGTIAFVATLVGIGVPDALLAALIDRAAEVLVTFVAGAWLAKSLLQTALSDSGQVGSRQP